MHRRYYVEIKCRLDATDEFLLQILVLAQHHSGAPLCPSSGAREYFISGCCLSYLVLGFQVVRAAAARKPDTQPPAPHHTDNINKIVGHVAQSVERLSYGLDGPGIESPGGRDFPHLSRPALRPNQPPVQWVPGLSRG
jgi:hypothetical protein